MSIADKVVTVAENEQKAIELNKRIGQAITGSNATLSENADNIEQLNANLEQTLYGTDIGGKSYYDMFWDTIQNYGDRRDYQYAFGKVWTDELFKPKYDIILGSNYMGGQVFWQSGIQDLKGILERQGVSLITTEATRFLQLFQSSKITNIPTIDMSNITDSGYAFSGAHITNIDKIISSEITVYTATCFNGCSKLTHVIFDGVIATNGLNIGWSTKLDTESIVSIVEALSATTSGLTVTLSQKAVDNMIFPITSEQSGITYNSWDELINTKSNWTISLV